MEAEQQQGQKTVVAFISGLLIGGLLMWVFGAEPKKDGAADVKKDDKKEETAKKDAVGDTKTAEVDNASADISVSKPEVSMTNAAITVENQVAGMKVALTDVKYPTDGGWMAVHGMNGEELGAVLGASRFSVADGLMPKEIDLLGSLTSGETYAVVFHKTDGNRTYASKTDVVLTDADGKFIGSTFKAE